MTKETKVKLLQKILSAGPKGTDREMLDNLKAVIKAIKSENGAVAEAINSGANVEKLCKDIGIIPPEEKLDVAPKEEIVEPCPLPIHKRKAGRPPKKR